MSSVIMWGKNDKVAKHTAATSNEAHKCNKMPVLQKEQKASTPFYKCKNCSNPFGNNLPASNPMPSRK